MKKTLLVACLAIFSTAAVGCVGDDADSTDNGADFTVIDGFDMQPDFEVIVVEGVALVGDDAESIQIEDGRLEAPRRDTDYVGGADSADPSGAIDSASSSLTGMTPIDWADRRSDDEYVGGADIVYGENALRGTSERFDAADRNDWNDARSDDELAAGANTDVLNRDSVTTIEASQSNDPCSCTTDDCRTEWVEDNLGCNVCAVFVCGEETSLHSCNACPQ